MGKAATAMMTAEVLVPRRRALRRVIWSVDSPVRTSREPIMEAITPMAAISMGTAKALRSLTDSMYPKAMTPREQEEIREPT